MRSVGRSEGSSRAVLTLEQVTIVTYLTDVLEAENLAEPLMAHANRIPERVAVVEYDASVRYGELARNVRMLAAYLASIGVKTGDRVAYVLPNSIELVTVFYATQFLGAAVVPINHRSVPVEIAFFLRSTGAAVVFTSEALLDRVEEAARSCGHECPVIQVIGDDSLSEILERTDLPEVEMLRDRGATARIQFTGGSTGVPKGVMRSHRADLVNVYGTAMSNHLYEDPTKIVLIQSPIDHHGGHAWLTQTLSHGGTAVLCQKLDAERVLGLVEKHRVSYLMLLPPSAFLRILDHPRLGEYDLSSVRLVQTSAGGMTRAIASRLYDTFPGAVVNYGWGQTESGLGTSFIVTRQMLDGSNPKLRSVGTVMPRVELRILDSCGAEVPVGEMGEAVVRSEAIMTGYFDQPGATGAAFTRDGWLKTGDVMSTDADGYFYLHSRLREIIKSGGENVFIAEVESAIKSHPAVLDCMVYGVADVELGEAVAAAVELRPTCDLSLPELQGWTRKRLASFKKPVRLTILPSLGRNDAGKLNRRAIIAECDRIQSQSLSYSTNTSSKGQS